MKELSFVVFASRQSALLKGGENLMQAVYDVFADFYRGYRIWVACIDGSI